MSKHVRGRLDDRVWHLEEGEDEEGASRRTEEYGWITKRPRNRGRSSSEGGGRVEAHMSSLRRKAQEGSRGVE